MNSLTAADDIKISAGWLAIFIGAALCLALAAPCAAIAEDYQIKILVPVQVKKLHPYATSIEAPCSLKDGNGNFINFDVAHSMNDRGTLDGTGSYSGTLAHSIKMFNPADAAKAKSYSCFLRINMNAMGHAAEYCPDPMQTYFCLKPGTASTLKVEGQIP